MNFTFPAAKFTSARITLMLPHPQGEDESIAEAFRECSFCFHSLNSKDLDDSAQAALIELKELMDTSGLDDPGERGLYLIKAESLTLEQRFHLSRVVDELAHWFNAQFGIVGA